MHINKNFEGTTLPVFNFEHRLVIACFDRMNQFNAALHESAYGP
jgi:hypothetical protein